VTRAVALALLVAAAVAPEAAAQQLQPEVRFEVAGPEPYLGAPGAALHLPMGRYVRVGVGGTFGAVNRADLLARFSFDPYRQTRWALSLGGGLSHDFERRRASLALHADLEGPRLRGTTPFVSAGLSGGARFAVGVRRAFPNRR
jgi:hypothetical protein